MNHHRGPRVRLVPRGEKTTLDCLQNTRDPTTNGCINEINLHAGLTVLYPASMPLGSPIGPVKQLRSSKMVIASAQGLAAGNRAPG